MESFFAVTALAVLVLIVILLVELKTMQRHVADLNDQMDLRLRQGLSQMAGSLDRLPAIEQRLQGLEQDLIERLTPPEPVPAAAAEPPTATATAPKR